VNRLAVCKRNDAQYTLFSVACVADRAPMAYPPILLNIAAQGRGDDGKAPCGVYVWPLSQHLIVEIACRFHAVAWFYVKRPINAANCHSISWTAVN
jgi:hypothetical protein